MTLAQLEKRVAKLEKRFDTQSPAPQTGKWWIDGAGRFADDPVFAEIVRLGREYRESLRPNPRRKKKVRRAHP